MSQSAPVVFMDSFTEANIIAGVLRIGVAMVDRDGKPVPAGTLVMPVQMLPRVTEALASIRMQIEAQHRAAMAAAAPASAAPAADSDQVAGAFRFNG